MVTTKVLLPCSIVVGQKNGVMYFIWTVLSILRSTLGKMHMEGVLVVANSWRETRKSLLFEQANRIIFGCVISGHMINSVSET